MQIRIEDIKIRKRVRKELGDLKSLMDSMKRFGLLSPVIISRDNELIAGHRRIESARRLGWKTIPVAIVDHEDDLEKLELEIEENIQRKDFTTDEMADGYLKLEKYRNPGIFLRILLWFKKFFRKLFRRFRRK